MTLLAFIYPPIILLSLSCLQVCADKGLPAIVLKVALHEEIEQVGSITAYGAQFGITALQDLIAKTGTHIRPSIKKCTGKLRKKEKDMRLMKKINEQNYYVFIMCTLMLNILSPNYVI